jgi:hypothetical protein
LDSNETESASILERGTAGARGALGQGQLGSVLARRPARGVGVVGSHGAALGRCHWRAAADARGALARGQLGSILTG